MKIVKQTYLPWNGMASAWWLARNPCQVKIWPDCTGLAGRAAPLQHMDSGSKTRQKIPEQSLVLFEQVFKCTKICKDKVLWLMRDLYS